MLYRSTSDSKLRSHAFTLIELLIVIVIIGILATALIPRLTGIQAKARDTKRLADLKQVQTALELFYNEKGSYPNTFNSRRSLCPFYNSGGIYTTQGASGYIPGLAPDYISELPTDPKPRADNECYLYRSIGTDYMFLVNRTVEGKQIPEYIRPLVPTQSSYAVYTPGARMW